MIEYCYETSFRLDEEDKTSSWIAEVIKQENRSMQNLVYIFCDDDRLLELNRKYLNHDTFTDILTFPYQDADGIQADIFISIPRVHENAEKLGVDKKEELRRVMIHGVLHLLGYNDHSEEEKEHMRKIEDQKLRMFHVEQ